MKEAIFEVRTIIFSLLFILYSISVVLMIEVGVMSYATTSNMFAFGFTNTTNNNNDNLLSGISSINTTTTISSLPSSFLDNIQTKKLRVGDIDIAYKIFGKGKPLILIPDFSMTMDMWDPNMVNKLSSNHTINNI
jgi:hypothetical protein